MQERKTRLTPIDQTWMESLRTYFDIPFPSWVESKKVGVDVGRLVKLMQLGGINNLEVGKSKENNDSAQTNFTIVGISPDGSAYAGRSRTKKKELFLSEVSDEPGSTMFHNLDWIDLGIRLDMKTLQKSMLDDKKSLKDVSTWTAYLDNVIRKGVREAGTKHLLKGHTKLQSIFTFLLYFNNVALASVNMSLGDVMLRRVPQSLDIERLAFSTTFNMLWWTLWFTATSKMERSGAGYRLSIFPGYEIDRALALQVLSRSRKVIREIKD